MRMPVMDGWAFRAALRERGIDVRVVVMTAAESARRWADQISADGHIAKPFDVDDLLKVIEQQLDQPDRKH